MDEQLFPAGLLSAVERAGIKSRGGGRNLLHGTHQTDRPGDSLEFHDFRSYTPGDDLRRVDWNIFRRHKRLFIRQYRHFPRMTHRIFLDGSASIRFDRARLQTVCRAAAVIGGVLLFHGDCIELHFSGRHRGRAFRSGKQDFPALLQELSVFCEASPEKRMPYRIDHRKVRNWVIADFLDPAGLTHLAGSLAAGAPFIPVRIVSPAELNPVLPGDVRLVDAESGNGVELTASREILDSYAAACRKLNGMLQEQALRAGNRIHQLNSAAPLQELLDTLLPGGVLETSV